MIIIKSLTADQGRACLQGLADLLRDAVDGGASVGFLPPLAETEALHFWHGVLAEVDAGRQMLLVALASGEVAGSVQVIPASMPNGSHRAEISKLFVHTKFRRQGIGRSLMSAAESTAKEMGRTLLVLDSRKGDVAEQLYSHMGYRRAGEVPRYARGPSGELNDTVFYYKELA